MTLEEKIQRLNELYHKLKSEGLTEEEAKEREQLKKEYVQSFKANFQAQLDSIKVQRPDGTIEKLKKVTAEENKLRDM